jgi:hypothetical protein
MFILLNCGPTGGLRARHWLLISPHSATSVEGSTTGGRQLAVGDLFSPFAAWRTKNLAPGEGRWLQLKLSVVSSSTISRTNKFSVDVELRSIDAYVQLDGGKASERDSWQVTSDSGTERLRFKPWADSSDERPTYKIDNPTRKHPVQGTFDWFDFVEVKGKVGDAAEVVFLTTIDGLQIEVPPAIRPKLVGIEEERLIKQWLTDRCVEKSDYVGAGFYRIAKIQLKVDSDEGN